MRLFSKVRKSAVYLHFSRDEAAGFLVISWMPRYIRWIGREDS